MARCRAVCLVACPSHEAGCVIAWASGLFAVVVILHWIHLIREGLQRLQLLSFSTAGRGSIGSGRCVPRGL